MPRADFSFPAKYWPDVRAMLERANVKFEQHQNTPELVSDVTMDDWREGEMQVTLADGDDLQHDEQGLASQLAGAINMLALVVKRAGGEIRLKRSDLQKAGGMVINSSHDLTTDEQVLRVAAVPPTSRR